VNPLSAVYAGAVVFRNVLYDAGVLHARRLSRPVISIGSIAAGGAGKTPFVIWLGEQLQQRGISFDVLSRGYGRASRGAMVVDPNGSPREFGDEPLLIARRLQCPVIVGESRHEAGLVAEYRFNSQFHLLDDGFQHRSLARNFDIALLTAKDLTDHMLPAGRLREPVASLKRADVVVSSRELSPEKLPVTLKKIWRIRRSIILPDVPSKPIVFCGIARPQEFVDQLKAANVRPAAFRFFRDHHRYSNEDMHELLTLRDQNRGGGFITTEKDVINIGPAGDQLGRVAIAQVVIELVEPTDALDTMLALITDGKPKA
jgi:tetraacyldisaccharide 4'-kinase